jgi:Glyoxalase-like domain
MIRGIDHLVIACENPDAAAEELEAALGIACTGGGHHEGAGTRNRIAWLADGSYVELIGVTDSGAARTSPVGASALRVLEEAGGGLATVALRADELEATVAGLRAAGSALGPLTHGSRTRDDGEVVQWYTSIPTGSLGPTRPFLIEHVYAGAEWGHAALAERARFVHPIGSPVVLARLDVATGEPASVAADLHDELGTDFWAVADLAVADFGPHVMRLVPSREMAVPAVVTLGAEVESPRTADLLGLRLDVERVEMRIPEPFPA